MSAASRWSDVGVFGRIFGPKKNHRGAASGMNSVVIISLSSWFALKCSGKCLACLAMPF